MSIIFVGARTIVNAGALEDGSRGLLDLGESCSPRNHPSREQTWEPRSSRAARSSQPRVKRGQTCSSTRPSPRWARTSTATARRSSTPPEPTSCPVASIHTPTWSFPSWAPWPPRTSSRAPPRRPSAGPPPSSTSSSPGPSKNILEAYKKWRGWAEKAATDYSFHVAITWWDESVSEDMGTLVKRLRGQLLQALHGLQERHHVRRRDPGEQLQALPRTRRPGHRARRERRAGLHGFNRTSTTRASTDQRGIRCPAPPRWRARPPTAPSGSPRCSACPSTWCTPPASTRWRPWAGPATRASRSSRRCSPSTSSSMTRCTGTPTGASPRTT